MNNVTLVGRITKDPELRTVSTGNTTCNFSVAVTRAFPNANGEREADFINCVIWGKQAENLCKYCKKGSLIGVTGRIQTRNYDGQDGKKVYVTEVVAANVTFLGSKNSSGAEFTSASENNMSSNSPIETSDVTEDPFKDFGSEVVLNDDDLPF
jgi:single-strand DNA-binding protein